MVLIEETIDLVEVNIEVILMIRADIARSVAQYVKIVTDRSFQTVIVLIWVVIITIHVIAPVAAMARITVRLCSSDLRLNGENFTFELVIGFWR